MADAAGAGSGGHRGDGQGGGPGRRAGGIGDGRGSPDGYQLTKEPVLRAAEEIVELHAAGERVVAAFQIERDRLASAMRPELIATQAALRMAAAGALFRQAYRQTANELRAGTLTPPADRGAAHLVSSETLAALRRDLGDRAERTAVGREREATAERLLCADS